MKNLYKPRMGSKPPALQPNLQQLFLTGVGMGSKTSNKRIFDCFNFYILGAFEKRINDTH